jgi:hypothetical protein
MELLILIKGITIIQTGLNNSKIIQFSITLHKIKQMKIWIPVKDITILQTGLKNSKIIQYLITKHKIGI